MRAMNPKRQLQHHRTTHANTMCTANDWTWSFGKLLTTTWTTGCCCCCCWGCCGDAAVMYKGGVPHLCCCGRTHPDPVGDGCPDAVCPLVVGTWQCWHCSAADVGYCSNSAGRYGVGPEAGTAQVVGAPASGGEAREGAFNVSQFCLSMFDFLTSYPIKANTNNTKCLNGNWLRQSIQTVVLTVTRYMRHAVKINSSIALLYGHFGLWTLRHQCEVSGQFGPTRVVPNCLRSICPYATNVIF